MFLLAKKKVGTGKEEQGKTERYKHVVPFAYGTYYTILRLSDGSLLTVTYGSCASWLFLLIVLIMSFGLLAFPMYMSVREHPEHIFFPKEGDSFDSFTPMDCLNHAWMSRDSGKRANPYLLFEANFALADISLTKRFFNHVQGMFRKRLRYF